MNFVGTGKRLEQGDIGFAAKTVGLPTAALLAFIEVEANGRGFDSSNRPTMLFEPHKFWKNLGPGPKRDKAAKLGLAYSSWGALPYPKGYDARWNQMAQAYAIDANAALKSASYGLPQILGENFGEASYLGPSAMVEDFKLGEREQLLAMVRLIKYRGLDKKILTAIKTGNWVPVAENYNGKLQARNDYSGKLKRSFAKHSNGETMTLPEVVKPYLEKGNKGEAVMNFQRDLVALGYDLGAAGADGRFGDDTDKAVRAFQKASGLTIDGKVGNATVKALSVAVAKLQEPKNEPAHTWPDQTQPGSATPANKTGVIVAGVIVALVLAAVAFFQFS